MRFAGGTITDNGETYDLAYAKKAMLVIVILPLLVMYTEAMLTPALPQIQREFVINPNDVSWILTIYLLVGTVSAAIFGKLGDMYGKKRMFLISLAFYTVGVIFNGFAPSFRWLLVSRAIQGIGMAIFPLAFSLVREEFPPKMVPQVQGMISAMFGVGMVIALPLGAYVTQHWGWRWTYHSAAPFVVLMFFLAWRVLRESRYINPGKVDWQGALFLSWAVIPALVAVTRAPNVGWSSRETITLFLVSIIGAIVLVLWERRSENPLIPLDIIGSRNPAIVNLGITFAAFGISMMSQANTYIFQMPPQFGGFGKTILQSGLLMTPMAGVMLVIAPLAGKVMPKIGAKPLALSGALIASSGLAVLAKYATHMSLWQFVGIITFVGAGITLMNISFINILVFSVPPRAMGVATGANSLFRNFGSTWGPAIAGTVMTMYYVLFQPPGAYRAIRIPTSKAYEVLFGTAAGIYIFLALLTLAIVEVMKGGEIRTGMTKSSVDTEEEEDVQVS